MANFRMEEISINDLIVNPENSRNIIYEKTWSEIETIDNLLVSEGGKMVDLAKNIEKNGLHPNEALIVVPAKEFGKYIVIEGNRRTASIKLMSVYKNSLNEFKLSKNYVSQLKKCSVNISKIHCSVFTDEKETREIVKRIHDSNVKAGRSAWDPIAQERNAEKDGRYTKALSILDAVYHSKFSSEEIKIKIKTSKKWYSKLQAFSKDAEMMEEFGCSFDSYQNLIIELEEEEVINSLSLLISLMMSKKNPGTKYFSNNENRKDFMKEKFTKDKLPDKSKINIKQVIFYVETKLFSELPEIDIMNSKYYKYFLEKQSNVEKNEKNLDKNDFEKNSDTNNTKSSDNFDNSNCSNKGCDNETEEEKSNIEEEVTPSSLKNENQPFEGIKTEGKAQNVLIIKDEIPIPHDYRKMRNLYSELRSIKLTNINCVSIGLRSFIEYSINCYLIKFTQFERYAFNHQIDFIQKIKKIVSHLVSSKGHKKDDLQKNYPLIFQFIDAEKDDMNYLNIKSLHLFVHHHDYEAEKSHVMSIYEKFKAFLCLLWQEISNA